jgi:hypothetical protein
MNASPKRGRTPFSRERLTEKALFGAVLTVALGLAMLDSPAAAQQPQASQLVITGAVPDPSGQTLTITGTSFGGRVLVTLDLVPVTVRYATDVQIDAAVPVSLMPPGTYLLP